MLKVQRILLISQLIIHHLIKTNSADDELVEVDYKSILGSEIRKRKSI